MDIIVVTASSGDWYIGPLFAVSQLMMMIL
jgi:hypothetical protein